MIPLSAPDIGPAEVAAVAEVLATPRLTIGPRLLGFERALALRVGVEHAVAVNSGTSALHLAVRALRLGDGDDVVTTPFTFVATANCLLYERARPVFVDIDPATRNIDPRRIERAITPRTRAILPVHVFGVPCDMASISAIADRHGLALIEDACEAIGATFRGRPVGSFGTLAAFSFYPNKQLTTAEGGAVLTRDPDLADACRMMRNHGRLGGGPMVHEVLGFNYRLSELHAALGLAQITRLDAILAARRRVAGWYTERLRGLPWLRLPSTPDATESWFAYVVELTHPRLVRERDAVVAALQSQGIGAATYFPPVHLQPPYRVALGHRLGDFPEAEQLAARTIALPFYTSLSSGEVDRVIDVLGRALQETLRGGGK